jgi:hypothetical protein
MEEVERRSLVGVFDFVGFRVFRGSLDRRFYRGDVKVAEERKGGRGRDFRDFRGCRMKRNAEAGREQRKTLSWILKVWSADLQSASLISWAFASFVVLWIEEFTAETLRALRDAEEEGWVKLKLG